MNNNPNWNSVWKSNLSIPTRIHHLRIFLAYKSILDDLCLKNPKIIELGCGTGELTARLLKRYGGTATLVDNNETAFHIASENFIRHKIKFTFIKKNIMKFKTNNKYDIVHSEGLIEHFTGKEQEKILEAHKMCVSEKGIILISVPRRTWYYSAARNFLEKIGKWPFGDEKPMDAKTLKKLLEKNKLYVRKCFNFGRFAFALATKKPC